MYDIRLCSEQRPLQKSAGKKVGWNFDHGYLFINVIDDTCAFFSMVFAYN
jgi:hypothetical protein